MLYITVEGLMIKFVVFAMITVDDWVVVGLAVVNFSGPCMVLRVYAPGVHRGTVFCNIMGGASDNGGFNSNCWMDLMIGVEVACAIVVSEGVLLAV